MPALCVSVYQVFRQGLTLQCLLLLFPASSNPFDHPLDQQARVPLHPSTPNLAHNTIHCCTQETTDSSLVR